MNASDATLKLLEAMLVYFQGEKIEALVFILPIGLLSLVFGAWLVVDGGDGFARGVAIPFLLYDGVLFGVLSTRQWGTWLMVVAAVLTVWSMFYYLRLAWPLIKEKAGDML